MSVAKELAKEAQKKGICSEWHGELRKLGDNKRAMLQMYIKGIDFCLKNDFPSNDYIRANFKGTMEDFGVFLDEPNLNITNFSKCVALGKTTGIVTTTGFQVCEAFIKHQSDITIEAKDNAFIVVDVFDNTTLKVNAHYRAKVCVNRYGGKVITSTDDGAMIKVIEKHKKTY